MRYTPYPNICIQVVKKLVNIKEIMEKAAPKWYNCNCQENKTPSKGAAISC